MTLKCDFYIKERKKFCSAWAMKNDHLCFRHSKKPEVIAKRKEASSKGGKEVVKKSIVFKIGSLNSLSAIATAYKKMLKNYNCGNMNEQKFKLLSDSLGKYAEILNASEVEKEVEELGRKQGL